MDAIGHAASEIAMRSDLTIRCQRESQLMQIGERRRNSVTIITPVGRVDNNTCPAFQARLLGTIGLFGATVLLDMTRVPFISSRGLSILMITAKQLETTYSRFAVVGLQPIVHEIFGISRMSNVLQVFDTVATAFIDMRQSLKFRAME
ncbi:MAG TPA: STAS domain-containing protein [Acetobacteraceae bacterium]|nr:STAS domain-containing protein [Acetobacteraceae bacterium]